MRVLDGARLAVGDCSEQPACQTGHTDDAMGADAAAQAPVEDRFPGRTVDVIEMLESWNHGGGAHGHTNDLPLPTDGD